MICRVSGLLLVALGVYFALDIESGAALFFGMALLVVGLLIFLGSWAFFGGRAGGESGGVGNVSRGSDNGDGDGGA